MKTIRILLVEDNEGDIVLTQEALEESSFDNIVEVARDGKEALEYLAKITGSQSATLPDLVLLDINLPLKSGHEVLFEIKANASLKKIPVVILTTSSSDKDIKKAYQNHANCYISKPIEIDEFTDIIVGILSFWGEIATLPSRKN